MVDALIGVVTEAVLNKAISFAAEKISLAWGVKKELKKLAEKLEMIQALLSDAQSKQATTESVKLWLKKLRSVSLDAQIVLDEFDYEFLSHQIEGNKVRDWVSSSNPAYFRFKMGHKIKDVLLYFEDLCVESNQIGLQAGQLMNSVPVEKQLRLTVPYVEESKIVGRAEDVVEITRLLTATEYEMVLPVITILGMGGQGKTTLAQLVYNHDTVKKYFDKTVWVTVSDDFNVTRFLAEMNRSSTQIDYRCANVEVLVKNLKEQLEGKRYLLVLDDVWNDNVEDWNRMRACLLAVGGSKESKILTTTRKVHVASTMQTSRCHELNILSEEQGWDLFKKYAFADGGATMTPQLIDIGKRILKKCGGVPLAIITIGGLLYTKSKPDFWLVIETNETWITYGEETGVLSVIKLSYEYLPNLSLKQCFAYCAMFEKDEIMEKDKLVQLWMAHGLLYPQKGSHSQMEDIGSIYFDDLIMSSLLQGCDKDLENNFVSCRMHDLVHDVSLQVSENWCYHVKDLDVEMKEIEPVHLSINSSKRKNWEGLKGVLPSRLRTLILKNVDLSVDLFRSFKFISVLIVVNWKATELPRSIDNMRHLRFLDIRKTDIKRLPKSFAKLYHLQTLRVGDLEELPEGFMGLINLRHIHMRKYSEFLFPGISQLRNLQTLPHFKVDKSVGCQIEELEHMDCLRGAFRIVDIQNVASYESATKSNLFKKSNIRSLELCWDKREGDDSDDHTEVMEGLKPHPSLKGLKIEGYQSPRFPSWMDKENNLLCNLVKLELQGLHKCETLPSLGCLPFLKDLTISSLNNVKCIGKEFYGWSDHEWTTNTKSCHSSNEMEIITLFPALQTLYLEEMESVVEWMDPTEIIVTPPSSAFQVKAFPCLERLTIYKLPKLSVFPNFGGLPSLRELGVQDCQNLSIPSGEWNRRGLHSDIQYHFPSLHYVDLRDCDKLSASFSSLIESLAPLRTLYMQGHPDSWLKDPQHLISLHYLGLEIGDLETDSFPWPFPMNYLPSLTYLSLYGSTSFVLYLPSQIQYLTSLIRLQISNFDGLEVIPEWVGDLESLQDLEFTYCKKLKELPSAEAFQRLTNLRRLHISFCPLLKKKCTKESGSEWPKIAHIPDLTFQIA